MTFTATKHRVNQHDPAPDHFLNDLVTWAKNAPDSLFEVNKNYDIYSRVKEELGPFPTLIYRKGVMCEVLTCLAAFESDYDYTDGVDTSRLGDTTPENAEAGVFQESYDSRRLDPSLAKFLTDNGVTNGILFQRKMKFEPIKYAFPYTAMILRLDSKDPTRLPNGPLYKGDERNFIRKSLRGATNSIYPWLSRPAVEEYTHLLAT